MEQNQTPDPHPTTSLFQMNLDAQNSYNLRSAASWAKEKMLAVKNKKVKKLSLKFFMFVWLKTKRVLTTELVCK